MESGPGGILVLYLERERIQAHLLQHGKESVTAGGREVLGQPYPVNEIEVCRCDFLRRVAVEHLYEQRYDAFYDYGVGVGRILDFAVFFAGIEPYAALAAFYQVVGSLVFGVDGRKGVAEIDNHGITVHPVVHFREFFYYFVLYLVYCHGLKVECLTNLVKIPGDSAEKAIKTLQAR